MALTINIQQKELLEGGDLQEELLEWQDLQKEILKRGIVEKNTGSQ